MTKYSKEIIDLESKGTFKTILINEFINKLFFLSFI